jgi:hypothetical protein
MPSKMEKMVFREVGRSNFIRAPKLHGSSLKFENRVRFPFLALSWVEESPLPWTYTYPLRPIRDKVLRQVAQIQVLLIDCTKEIGGMFRFHCSGTNKLTTRIQGSSTSYFSSLVNNRLHRVRNHQISDLIE